MANAIIVLVTFGEKIDTEDQEVNKQTFGSSEFLNIALITLIHITPCISVTKHCI